jgi:hypothetical protein
MQDLKTAFDTYTDSDEPPMRLQSGAVLAAARRSKRTRKALGIAGFAAVALAITLTVVPALGQVDRQEGLSPAANPVDTPAVIESAVRAWAGADYAGFVLDDIYPSDWTRTTALPNGQEANATDWHGRWTLPSGEFLVVSLMYYAPNAAGPECNPPNCSIRTTTEGTTTLTDVYFMGSGSVASVARDERGDGFAVLVWLEAPTQSFSYTPEKLLDLATDPSLTFPYPAVVPKG